MTKGMPHSRGKKGEGRRKKEGLQKEEDAEKESKRGKRRGSLMRFAEWIRD